MPKKEQRSWNFSPVETKRAYETVYDEIYKKIISGELRPGDKLPSERQLMKIFGRSHPTIREAIRMLDQAGLVTVVPGGGTVIAEVTSDYIARPLEQMLSQQDLSPDEILEYLLANEAEYISAAAAKCSSEDAKKLWDIFEAFSGETCEGFVENDTALHEALMKISGNRVAEIVCSSVRKILRPQLDICFRAMPGPSRAEFCAARRAEHEKLIEAVEQNDAALALSIANAHISRAKELFDSYYSERGLL